MIERSIIITEDIKQSGSPQMSTAQIELYTEEYAALPDKRELIKATFHWHQSTKLYYMKIIQANCQILSRKSMP